MAKQRHLRNAPIVEALIDIRTTTPVDFDVARFTMLPKTLEQRFPRAEALRAFSGGFEIDGQLQQIRSHTVNQGILGYLYRSETNDRVLQARKDGFTFSKLQPYEDWSKLRSEAVELWDMYVSVAKPEQISRLALRYINRLNIPTTSGKFDFDEYFTAAPQVPEGLPQAISGFLYRVHLPNPEINAAAIIHQALEPASSPSMVTVLLDIDVFVHQTFAPSDRTMMGAFEHLHDFKNKIFFEYITEKTAEIFQ